MNGREKPGHVWLVGAGPGDPGLVTVAGLRALRNADVVLYDALAPAALLRELRPGAEALYVGKRAGRHGLSQEETQRLMVERARQGENVVRLKGGDPFVFGRGGEEALACREAGIGFTIVPGVTSAIAAPAYAGIPVTQRGMAASLVVVTGSPSGEEDGAEVDWGAAARADTLVILMGVGSLPQAMAALMAAGRSPETPVACVRWGSRPDQEVLTGTVGDITERARAACLQSPVATVVGEVVRLREALDWFRPGPLAGKRVVVTRARAQASELAAMLEDRGAYVVEAPAIRVEPRRHDAALQAALASAADWVVLTSANAAEALFGALEELGLDGRALAGRKLAAIGAATDAELRSRGLRADFVPSRATSDALAIELPVQPRERVLLPVSALADTRLADALAVRGAEVSRVVAYDTVVEALDEERLREVAEADVITFTSASTARNLRQALGATIDVAGAKLVSIGPETSAAVREAFGRVDAEAPEPSLGALVAAVEEALR
jgi:uroporphyrinogen III methyltransferase/synthase